MRAQAVAERRSRAAIAPFSRTIRILLVEDCKSDVFLMTRMLSEAALTSCFHIVDVPRLADAFSKIDEEEFDLIMLDLNLIDIGGTTCISALHAEAPPGTPIIVYSGMDDQKMREAAMLCGAAHYLVKGRESGYSLKHIIERTTGCA